ncbi:MAG: NAD(P)-binding domain-containing protein [Alphaproteobacteria bacterium]
MTALPIERPPPEGADAAGLAVLQARLDEDLSRLNYPPANWVQPVDHPAAGRVVDVTIVGAGMCGLAAAFSLLRLGVRNIRILDKAPAGREGPWVTSARMETLRSPKELTGPAAGMASLTFRAWHEAQFGRDGWARLGRIPRTMWMDYLGWYRTALRLPVENGIEVTRIIPEDGLLRLDLAGGAAPSMLTRKVVMATGRDGLGRPYAPEFVAGLPHGVWAHSADDIDFTALAGKRVVVVGAGASAMDNAAEALEHGATEVRLLVRRPVMPRINKLMGIGSAGFTAGFPMLSEEWRWRFMQYANREQTPAPRNSTQRVSRHPNASFHLGTGIRGVTCAGGELRIDTTREKVFAADFMILATGFTVEVDVRPELAAFADRIALWRDRYTPPPELADADLGRHPYLGTAFEFTEREPGTAPWLADIHCFNHASSLSLGKVSGDIPKVSDGAAWLAQGIAGRFFRADVERHWQWLVAYEKPELLGDEWTDAEAE